jgi:hypothetical protein
LWLAGREAGVIALGEVTGVVEDVVGSDDPYWTDRADAEAVRMRMPLATGGGPTRGNLRPPRPIPRPIRPTEQALTGEVPMNSARAQHGLRVARTLPAAQFLSAGSSPKRGSA